MAAEKAKEFLLALKEKGADEAWTEKAAEMKTNEEKFALAAEMAKESSMPQARRTAANYMISCVRARRSSETGTEAF